MMPLAGRKILITRARHQASALADALEEKGAKVLSVPAIEIVPPDSYEPLDAALREAKKYHWLIVTSVNGVEVLAQRLEKLARETLAAPLIATESPHSLKIAAMGPATARALEAHGLPVDVVPEKYIAESLVESLRDQVFGQNVLLVRAKVARDVVPAELAGAGAHVDVVDAYQTVVPESSRVALRSILDQSGALPDAVTFTSSSTVTNFFRLLHESGAPGWPASVAAASIGPITTRTLLDHAIEPVVEATEYTIPGLVDALCRWYAP
jgi:uroporphyrinogen-III synthase